MQLKKIRKIKKRDGRIVDFDQSKITNAIYKATVAVGKPDYELAQKLSDKVVEGLKRRGKKIPAVEEIQDIVEQVLMEHGEARVAKAYILYRQKRTQIRKEKQQILDKEEIDEVDKAFDINALRVLRSRYLRKGKDGKVIESPKQLFERVAIHTALPSIFFDKRVFQKGGGEKIHPEEEFNEKRWEGKIKIGKFLLNQFHLEALKRLYDRFNRKGQMKLSWSKFLELLKAGEFDSYEREIEEYYNLMAGRKFMPNTPALANFGNYLGMGSACFVLGIEDSIESIMDTLKQASIIFKAGGGAGYNFSKLRPEGDFVKTTGGVASGPISFMTLFDRMTEVIKQGGIRRGANMGILNSNHPDIEKFIVAKKENRALHNFNISVFILSDFWNYYRENKPYPLVNPRTNEVVKYVNPRNLLDLIAYQAWESAEPGVIYDDVVNRYNPFLETLGPIQATNPCVTSDTWIFTSVGPRQVKELIDKGFEVILNGQRYKSSGFFFTGIKDVYRIKTKEGYEVCLTEEHLVRKVEKLTRYKIESRWEEVRNLKVNDKLVLDKSEIEWGGKFGEEEGYLVGHYIGDGTKWKDKVFLQSWGEGDGEEAVRAKIEKIVKKYPHRKDFKGWVYNPKDKRYRLSFSSLDKLIKELGLKRKGITPEIEKASSAFYKGFLRGLFDTDGSVQGGQEKGVSIRLAQSDLEILKGVQRMLLRLGIFSKIYTDRREERESLLPDGKGSYKFYKTKSQHELIISEENILKFYEKIGFWNVDKKRKLEELIKKYKRRLNKERFLVTVKEIVKEGKEKVYDAIVCDVHAFNANGFYLHNCGEVLLYPYESCNLGSINLWAFVKESPTNGGGRKVEFDWDGFAKTVHIATRFLDNVVEVNKYPLKEIEEMTLNTRKIGLGVMGLGNLLYDLEIPYNSEEGFKFMERLMEFVNYHSKLESIKLARERGKFPYYNKSFYPKGKMPFAGFYDRKSWHMDWDEVVEKIKKYGIRNAFTTVIAPTGSISMIAGCSSGIEPVFSLVYEKRVTVGSFYYIDPVFEKIMLREGLFDEDLIRETAERNGSIQDLPYIPERLKKIFVTAMDIKAPDHIRALAAFQRWTDSSISKTINFPATATIEEVREAILLAHELGCKDLTIYRDKSISGVYIAGSRKKEKKGIKLTSLTDVKAKGPAIYHEAGASLEEGLAIEEEKCPNCGGTVVREEGCKRCLECGWSVCSL